MTNNETSVRQDERDSGQRPASANDIPPLWKKLEVLSKVIASVLIPVTIALVGEATKTSIESQNIGLKYIELSLGVLKEKPTPDAENLRKWAIGIVNHYSTVPLTEGARKELEMKPLPSGDISAAVVTRFEAFLPKAYLDPTGAWAIGYSHLLTPDEMNSGTISVNGRAIDFRNGITEEQAQQILGADLKPINQAIDELVKVPLTPNQRAALVSFIWNAGIANFKASSILKKINDAKYSEVPAEMQRWTKAGGRALPGLVRRRQFETEIWNNPDSAK